MIVIYTQVTSKYWVNFRGFTFEWLRRSAFSHGGPHNVFGYYTQRRTWFIGRDMSRSPPDSDSLAIRRFGSLHRDQLLLYRYCTMTLRDLAWPPVTSRKELKFNRELPWHSLDLRMHSYARPNSNRFTGLFTALHDMQVLEHSNGAVRFRDFLHVAIRAPRRFGQP